MSGMSSICALLGSSSSPMRTLSASVNNTGNITMSMSSNTACLARRGASCSQLSQSCFGTGLDLGIPILNIHCDLH